MVHELLEGHAFIAGLSDAQIKKLASLACEVSFEENEFVLHAGQQSRHFYLMLTGSVCVEARGRGYTVTVQAVGPGETIGWSAFLEHHDTLFQVRARERSTALCLEGVALNAMLREDPELAAELLRRVLEVVAGRVQATETVLGEMIGVRLRS
jgi:CRP-like cAMP-binding protein